MLLKQLTKDAEIWLRCQGYTQSTIYHILLTELAAGDYSKAQKDNLMAQYLYNLDFDMIYPETGENQYPMLSIEWNCMAQDYETSLQLFLKIMGGLKSDDRDELIRILDKYLPSLDCSRKDPYDLESSIAEAGVGRSSQYRDYLSGQRFYEFAKGLRKRLDTDSGAVEEIGAKLDSIQKLILHRDRMVVMNVAPESELEQISGISRQILWGLPSLGEAEADYELPEYPARTAVIVEGSNYNTYSISDTALVEGLSGSLFPFVMALSDRYIVPAIRFQGLAYSAGMGHYISLKYIYTYTYSDYSYVTNPLENLNKYLYAMNQDLTGFDVENWRRLAGEIRTATVDDKEQAVETLRKLLENQHLVTVGNAELIRKEADTFDQVYDFREPLEP